MARDLLQRRCTDAMGQTEWKDSAVVEALLGQHGGNRNKENFEQRMLRFTCIPQSLCFILLCCSSFWTNYNDNIVDVKYAT